MTIDGAQQLLKAAVLMTLITCVRTMEIFVVLYNCIVSCVRLSRDKVKIYQFFLLSNQKPTTFGMFLGIIIHLRDPVISKLSLGACVRWYSVFVCGVEKLGEEC